MNTTTGRVATFGLAACLVVVTFALHPAFYNGIRELRILLFAKVAIGAALWWLAPTAPARLLAVAAGLSFAFVRDDLRSTVCLVILAGVFALMRWAERVDRETIYSALVICALVQVAYQGVQLAGLDFIFAAKTGRGGHELLTGFAGNLDLAASLQALALPFCFKGWRRYAAPVLLVALAYGNVFTALAAVGVAAVALAVYVTRRSTDRVFVWVLLAVFASAFVSQPQLYAQFATDARFDVWALSIGDSIGRPLGHGLGSFAAAGYVADGMRFGEAHNEYVQVFHELGYLGVAAGAWAVADYMRRAWAQGPAQVAAVAVLAVLCLGAFPFHSADVGGWAAVVLGGLKR